MIAHSTPQTEKEFREARKIAQRKVRLARAKWWSEKANALNDMSKEHDKKLFQKIKELRFIWTPGRRFGIHTIRNKDGRRSLTQMTSLVVGLNILRGYL
jgi:hypothetical protein